MFNQTRLASFSLQMSTAFTLQPRETDNAETATLSQSSSTFVQCHPNQSAALEPPQPTATADADYDLNIIRERTYSQLRFYHFTSSFKSEFRFYGIIIC
jgi:hypothetical protein